MGCWALVGPAVANVVARFEAQMASARFNVVGAVLLLFLPTCGAFALRNALRTRVLSPSIALSANNDYFDLAARVETVVANINEGTFGERGEAWVFGQFGLLFAILGAPAIPGLSTLAAIAGILSILGGGALAVAGAYGLGSDLTPWPKPTEANTLKTSGIYSLCRHPVYSGLLAACLGLSLLSGSPERLLLTICLTVLLNYKADREEALLAEVHGDAYATYTQRTPKLLPTIGAVRELLSGQ